MNWRAIIGFRLVTSDIDRSSRFYVELGFKLGSRLPIGSEEMAVLGLQGAGMRQEITLGPSYVDLDCFERPGRPYPDECDAASLLFQHLAIVTDDAAAGWTRATAAGAIAISRDGPVTLPRSNGCVTAMKFRDPDGHPLEILQFPDGAAQGWPGSGMLGIDHSAISVADVMASQHFYEAQGLALGETTQNLGPAQVRLDALDNVDVDVVPLQPAMTPPHLELLGYRHPKGSWFGHLATNDVAATRVVWRAGERGLVRDPDGHLHQLEM